jgi:hypothetical protein
MRKEQTNKITQHTNNHKMILRERKTKNKINLKELVDSNEKNESSYKLSNESENSDNEIEGKKRRTRRINVEKKN